MFMKILYEFDNKKFDKFWYCKTDFRGKIRGIRANSARVYPRGRPDFRGYPSEKIQRKYQGCQ